MANYLYALIIYPLEMFIETVFSISMDMIPGVGYAILFVSLAVQLLAFPMYKRADELQEEERDRQKVMEPTVKHIKKTFKGEERVMMLSTYYREEHYHTYYQLKAILPLLLQIPFFIAAYNFLSSCKALDGASFYFLRDMGKPDAMMNICGFTVNIMPIAMTAINLISGMIYTRGLELKDKLQLVLTAGVFLVLLYNSPSGLVFYWTLNNVFSLLKNIFMKLVKNPREIASVGAVLFVIAYCYKCIAKGALSSSSGRIVLALVLLIGLIPGFGVLRDRIKKGQNIAAIETREDRKSFLISSTIAALTTGFLIPITTISTSPTEFVIRGHYVNPLVNVMYSLVVAIGIFIVWGGIFYYINSPGVRHMMSKLMLIISICSLVNSIFFKQHLFNMTNQMQYNVIVEWNLKEKLINIICLIIVFLGVMFFLKKSKKVTYLLTWSLLMVVIVMCGYNTYNVQKTINTTPHISDDEYYINNKAHFAVDRNGKNVFIFMLDRAFGQFLPYIINERPEITDIYSGFTFYPNAISHGMRTAVGTPGIFGGYDYTAIHVKDMIGDDYISYRKKSYDVLPKLFSDAGYKCTVFDPPPYIDLGEETIEEHYHKISPNIDGYYADGVMKTREEAERDFNYLQYASRKNYIRHSIFLATPLFLRSFIYDDGAYLMQERVDDRLVYAGHIEALNKLPEMTHITDSGVNTFTIIENEVTHSENVDLQMPEYTLEEDVDNSAYLEEWRDKLTHTPGDDKRQIQMYSRQNIQSYGTNVAALLSIGRWLEYLKQNDLYDNSRIIIVADHGYNFFAFEDMLFEANGEMTDLEMMTPLMMVKDFGNGDFSVSNEFMTNADVPSIAMKGLIENPINPYTGNPINCDEKYQKEQYVFDNARWLTIHDDIYDRSNWNAVDVKYNNKQLVE